MNNKVTPRNISGEFTWDELSDELQKAVVHANCDIRNEILQRQESPTSKKYIYVVENGYLQGWKEKKEKETHEDKLHKK